MVALGGLCLALTALPLFGTLGYENAFVLAPVLSGLGIAAGVDALRSAKQAPQFSRPALWRHGAREIASLHAVALGVLLLGRLWQPGCDPWGGLLFYGMGPGVSSILGWSCGIWAASVDRSRRVQLLLGFVPMLAAFVLGVWRLYRHPVVFAYDPFWGYFSGSIYDESITVDDRYFRFRAYNLLAAASAWALWFAFYDVARHRLRRPAWSSNTARIGLALGLLGGTASLHVFRNAAAFGFTADIDSITEHLSGRYETEHFVLHYPPRSPYARIIADLAREHEFAWDQLAQQMGRAPAGRVHSFLFADAQQKRKLMGAGTVQVAAPWRKQIYLDHRGFPHPVMHHELAHVFGATIGDPLLGLSLRGLSPNMGLIEGLATALAPRPSDRLDLHDQAKVLIELGRLPPLAGVMGPAFFAQSSRVAYIAAGSFCRWLIDTRGFEPMAALYRSGGDFEAAYGESLARLEDAWVTFLRAYEGVRPRDVEIQAERFQRRPVFDRPCAHVVADLHHEIRRAQDRGHVDVALDGLRTLCALEPGEPGHRIAWAMGLAHAGQYDDAEAMLRSLAERPDLPSTVRATIAERRGDIALRADAPSRAAEAYEAALREPSDEDHHRVLRLKLRAAADPSLRRPILRYFGELATPAENLAKPVLQTFIASQLRERPPHRELGSYLLGRLLLNAQEVEAAHAMFTDALADPEALPDPAFVQAARHGLLVTSLLTGRYDDARRQVAALAAEPDLGNGPRRELEEWRARIAFFELTSPS